MTKVLATTLLVVLAAGGSAFAQPPDQKSVQDAVEAFLLHLGDHQFDKVAADLAPKSIVIVARERNGDPVTFREPITNVKATIDSDHLAYLRADFQVVRDGQALSHGVD